jgi:hypothetical protein
MAERNNSVWIFIFAVFILWVWAKSKKRNVVTQTEPQQTCPSIALNNPDVILNGPTRAVLCKCSPCVFIYPTYTGVAPQGKSPWGCVAKFGGAIPIIGPIIRGAATAACAATCKQRKTLCIGPQSACFKTPCDVKSYNYTTRLLGYCCSTLPLLPIPQTPSGSVASKCGPPAFQYDGQIFYPGQKRNNPNYLFPVDSCWLLGSYGYKPNPPGVPGGKCVPMTLTYPLGIVGATAEIPLDINVAHAAALQAFGVSEDANPISINGGF